MEQPQIPVQASIIERQRHMIGQQFKDELIFLGVRIGQWMLDREHPDGFSKQHQRHKNERLFWLCSFHKSDLKW